MSEPTVSFKGKDRRPIGGANDGAVQARPTARYVATIAADYYEKPMNGAGGSLHIVLDDGNYGKASTAYCREYALERGDDDGVRLADLMLQLSPTQIRRVGIVCHRIIWERQNKPRNTRKEGQG